MTTEQLLIGVSLTLLLAVGSQLPAGRLHLPALIVLLPVGLARPRPAVDRRPSSARRRIEVRTAGEPLATGDELLFVLRSDRRLEPTTQETAHARG